MTTAQSPKIRLKSQIKNDNGPITKDKTEILKETKRFYEKLWSVEDERENETVQNEYTRIMLSSKISDIDIKVLDEVITEKEIENAILQLNLESSPGSDGLTTQFYKKFAYLLKNDLVEIYNNCFLQREMSATMKKAIVKLIHKKGDKSLLKNWRPISILNTDYKILSKLLANRLTPIMNRIISPNQKCGLPKRRIEQLLYNVQAAFEIAKEKDETLGFMLIDFEKAFDRLSHKFIFKIFMLIDFEKAFDRLSHKFIFKIFQNLGFGTNILT